MDLILKNGKEIMRARADIVGEGITGEAEFVELDFSHQCGSIVKVTVKVKGDPSVLTPGMHGCHIHENGLCEPHFQSAGGHFDPGPAGNTDPDVNHPYHSGDLPNIHIDENGEGYLETVTTRITLSDGPLSILAGDGTCLMVHGNEDQCMPGEHKSGVSGGPRAACGVIRAV